jgi:hypothetical protein
VSLPRPSNSQRISGNISRIITVALDPRKRRLHTSSLSLINDLPNLNHQIFIRNICARRGLPSVFLPGNIPDCRTINTIAAIGDDLEWAGLGCDLKRSLNTGQLRSLVGLVTFERL